MVTCSQRRTDCLGWTHCRKDSRYCGNLRVLWCKGIIIGLFVILAGVAFAYGIVWGWQNAEDRAEANRFKGVVLHHKLERLQQQIQAEIKLREQILAVIACESSGRHEGIWGDNGRSYGIAQIQKPTWNYLSGMAGIKGNWKDKQDQIRLLEWAIQNGHGKHWTCYRRLKDKSV